MGCLVARRFKSFEGVRRVKFRGSWLWWGMALLGLALLPREINEYYIHQGVLIAIYAILLFGLDVVVGYTGEVS
ncbi:MAG: hypothetical protein G3H99_07490, partial [Ferrovum sp.]|nr:hypothetical protein [Ferrovum sp.]